MTMADLLAAQDRKASPFSVFRGQELEGRVTLITSQEIILDLGTKSEGTLPKRELNASQLENLKVGDKLTVNVIATENESGQVVLTTKKGSLQKPGGAVRWDKFAQSLENETVLTGKGLEVNKGGLIVEVNGVRGFLPSSQVSLTSAQNLEELIGKEIQVLVIEVDPNQNRLIFSQKTQVTEDTKKVLGQLKIGDKVQGKVAAVLPFGIFVTLDNGVEGLVHISEIAWEKVDDPSKHFKVADKVSTQVISIETSSGRVNLSLKQLLEDPFVKLSQKYTQEDIVKGVITKIASNGLYIDLEGIEGLIPTPKLETGVDYQVGQSLSCIVDTIDTHKRRITLSPFVTTTKGLIYK